MTTPVVLALSRDPYRVISRLGAVADAFYYPRTPVVMGSGPKCAIAHKAGTTT
ncbi:hypothetical protein V1289_003500 [Bradyrhizobium sp. AZCC 2289]